MLKEVLVHFDFNVKFLYVRALCFCRKSLRILLLKWLNRVKFLTPGAEKQTKRELFDALRQELE